MKRIIRILYKSLTALTALTFFLTQPIWGASVYDEWLYGVGGANEVKSEEPVEQSADIDTLNGLSGLFGLSNALMPGVRISRGEFLNIIMKIAQKGNVLTSEESRFSDIAVNDSYCDAATAAVDLKIIDGAENGLFYPDENISLTAAQKIIVNVLGYRDIAMENGGFPYGYEVLARRLGIGSAVIDRDGLYSQEVAGLILNMLDAEIADIKAVSVKRINGDPYIESKYNKTSSFLSVMYGVEKISGVAEGNEYTRLFSKDGLGKGKIMIDNVLYGYDKDDVKDLLGKYITAYVIDKDKRVVYIRDDEDYKMTVISSDDIENIANRCITYTKDNKVLRVDIPKGAAVIYNNVCLPNYSMEDLNIKNGCIEIIKNPSDRGTAVKIFEYIPAVVSGADTENRIIFAKTKDLKAQSVSEVAVKYEADKFDSFELFDAKGVKPSFEDIKADMVLNVLVSKDGRHMSAYQKGAQSSGKLEAKYMGDSPKIVVNADTCELSEMIMSDVDKINLGKSVSIYTDMFGKVVRVKEGKTISELFAYLVDVAKETVIDTKYKFKLYDQTGEIKILNSSDNIKVNGQKLSNVSKVIDNLEFPIAVLYTVDEYGDVNNIYLPDSEGSMLKSICKTPNEKLFYNGGGNLRFAAESGFDGSGFMIDKDTVILETPPDIKDADASLFRKMDPASISQFARYSLMSYTTSDTVGAAEYVIITAKNGDVKKSKDAAFVADIWEGLKSDGTVTKELKLTSYSFSDKVFKTTDASVISNLTLTTPNGDVQTNVEIGDLIIYNTDAANNIYDIVIAAKGIVKTDEIKYWSNTQYNGAWYDNLALFHGKINQVKDFYVNFSLFNDANSRFNILLNDTIKIIEYNRSAERECDKVRYLDKNQLFVDADNNSDGKVLLYVKTGTPRIMIIYK